jgi:hypothetical protein
MAQSNFFIYPQDDGNTLLIPLHAGVTISWNTSFSYASLLVYQQIVGNDYASSNLLGM